MVSSVETEGRRTFFIVAYITRPLYFAKRRSVQKYSRSICRREIGKQNSALEYKVSRFYVSDPLLRYGFCEESILPVLVAILYNQGG